MSQTAAKIPEKLFFKIGEVCDIAGVQAHVLRYWESEFPMLAPQKNRAGQRTYRRRDVEMALRIKELLYDDQYTIAGAKKKLAGELRAPAREKVSTSVHDSAPTLQRSPRSLTPPASLQDASPERSNDNSLSADQRAALREIAAELREILDLLDRGDAETKRSRR
jgi:DNA-binding transcriptional MerR regulator